MVKKQKHVGCCTKVKFCFNDLVGLGIVNSSKSLPDNYSEITIIMPTNEAKKMFDKLGPACPSRKRRGINENLTSP